MLLIPTMLFILAVLLGGCDTADKNNLAPHHTPEGFQNHAQTPPSGTLEMAMGAILE